MWNKNWKVKQNLAKIFMAKSSGNYEITQEQGWFIRPDNSRIKTMDWGSSTNPDICRGGFLIDTSYSNLLIYYVDYSSSDIEK